MAAQPCLDRIELSPWTGGSRCLGGLGHDMQVPSRERLKSGRMEVVQLFNHQQERPGTRPIESSRAARVGETRTGPKASPAITSSSQSVTRCPIGETTHRHRKSPPVRVWPCPSERSPIGLRHRLEHWALGGTSRPRTGFTWPVRQLYGRRDGERRRPTHTTLGVYRCGGWALALSG